MQDAIMDLQDMIMCMGPIKITVLMMTIAALFIIPMVRLMTQKTSLIEKILLYSFMFMITWFQWWLVSI